MEDPPVYTPEAAKMSNSQGDGEHFVQPPSGKLERTAAPQHAAPQRPGTYKCFLSGVCLQLGNPQHATLTFLSEAWNPESNSSL